MRFPRLLQLLGGKNEKEEPAALPDDIRDERAKTHTKTEHVICTNEPTMQELIAEFVQKHRPVHERGPQEGEFPPGAEVITFLRTKMPKEPLENLAQAMNESGYVMQQRGGSRPPNTKDIVLEPYGRTGWWVGYYHRDDSRIAETA